MIERGELDTYEITWNSGHIETVIAHQVSWPNIMNNRPSVVCMHAEINGHWTLTLQAREEDIRTIRRVTVPENVSEILS